MKKSSLITMFVSATISFFLVLLISYLALEQSAIFAAIFCSLPVYSLSIAIGLTISKSVNSDNNYNDFSTMVVILSVLYFLLVIQMLVWWALLKKFSFDNKTTSLWASFACSMPIYLTTVIVLLVLYCTNTKFRNMVSAST